MGTYRDALGAPDFPCVCPPGQIHEGTDRQDGEFTVSIPLEKPDAAISKICGWQSGFNIDKVKEAGLELSNAESNNTPGVKQYPLTIECKVLYSQDQDLSKIPEDIREKMYPQDVDGTYPMANRDAHTMYVGQIVDAYIIR